MAPLSLLLPLALRLATPLALGSPPAEPLELLRSEGCLACHPGGGAGVGPELAALVGRTEHVVKAGAPTDVVVDAAYLRRALSEPGAEVVSGFPSGLMPPVTEPARVDRLLAALTALSPAVPPSPGWLAGVFLGGLAFAGGHLTLSGDRLRERIIGRLGRNGFMGIYSLCVAPALGVLAYCWTKAPFIPVWAPAPWTRWVPLLVMPFVMIAQVAGNSTAAPTISGFASRVGDTPRGIHRITRHPVNISSAIWALAHLFPNGDVASIGLFGTILVLGVAGSLHIDRRLARTAPEDWARYTAVTSVLPFAAILEGRNTLSLREIGAVRIIGGLVFYGMVLSWHQWVMGASPWPIGSAPFG